MQWAGHTTIDGILAFVSHKLDDMDLLEAYDNEAPEQESVMEAIDIFNNVSLATLDDNP